MIKFNKGFLLSLLIVAILVPATASAGIYFMDKEEDINTKPGTIRPCNTRGFKLTSCGTNETPTDICAENDKFWRRCSCSTAIYQFTNDTCPGTQTVTGRYCKGQFDFPRYEKCDCDTSIYRYVPEGQVSTGASQCPATQSVSGGTCNRDNGIKLYQDCSCKNEYNQLCGHPYVGVGETCDGKYQECKCKPEYKTCPDGGKGGTCTDGSGTKYLTCFSDLKQMSFDIVNGMKQGAGKTCSDSAVKDGIPNAEVIFRKSQHPTVFVKANAAGKVSTHVPYDNDDETVSIEIKAENFMTITSTCPCDGKVYPLIPTNGNGSSGSGVNAAATIVLSWNNHIPDLDSHLLDSNNEHLYHGRKSITGASLDVDDTDCWGPETTTINSIGKRYAFSVLNFTDRKITGTEASDGENKGMNLSKTDAEVYLYMRGQLMKVFRIPKNTSGTLWTPFVIESNGDYRDLNKMTHSDVGYRFGTPDYEPDTVKAMKSAAGF